MESGLGEVKQQTPPQNRSLVGNDTQLCDGWRRPARPQPPPNIADQLAPARPTWRTRGAALPVNVVSSRPAPAHRFAVGSARLMHEPFRRRLPSRLRRSRVPAALDASHGERPSRAASFASPKPWPLNAPRSAISPAAISAPMPLIVRSGEKGLEVVYASLCAISRSSSRVRKSSPWPRSACRRR